MRRFNCFIELDTAELILLMQEDYPNLSLILSKYARLFINASESEVKGKLLDVDNPLFILHKNDGTEGTLPKAFKDELKKYLSNNDRFLDKPTSLAFLDIESEHAKSLREDYGHISITKNEIDEIGERIFEGAFYKRFKKGEEVEGAFRSHIDIYPSGESSDKMNLPCSNSLVISDPYIFSNSQKVGSELKNIGFENLKLLLNALLPGSLNVPFDLTIVTDDCKWSSSIASEKIEELSDYIKSIRSYPTNIELIIYGMKDKIHGRYVISNYYKITLDKGIKHFNIEDQKTVRETNDIRIEKNFNNVASPGETPYESAQEILDEVKDICRDAYQYTKNSRGTLGKIAVNSEGTSGVLNRLLK